MPKAFDEEMKARISDLFETEHMTNGEIARALGISTRSVRRYRHYLNQDPTPQINQTIEGAEEPIESIQSQPSNTIEEPDKIEYKAETTPNESITPVITKVRKLESCPECGTPKSEWIQLDQLDADDPQPTEEEMLNYDYICPKCYELISEYVCPECGASSSDWIPIDLHPDATEEEKRLYDYICPRCNELIKI